jgi:hypothetical protein
MLQLEHEVGGIKQTCIVEDRVETKQEREVDYIKL